MKPPARAGASLRLSGLLLAALLGLSLGGCGKKRAATELPHLGTLPAFELVDQSGAPLTQESMRGRVWAGAFMFTRCPTICPKITRAMREVQVRAKAAGTALHLVSFSVDPENDTPAVLTEYAKEHGAELGSWTFVTGDLDVIRKTAVDGFKLALDGTATEGAEHLGIVHGSHLVLVDRELRIRGYYRTLDADALSRLLIDAENL